MKFIHWSYVFLLTHSLSIEKGLSRNLGLFTTKKMIPKFLIYLLIFKSVFAQLEEEHDEFELQKKVPAELKLDPKHPAPFLNFVSDLTVEHFFSKGSTQNRSPPPKDVACNNERESVDSGYYKRVRSPSYPRNARKMSA